MNGEYQHALDSKGRLFMPARLRDELGESFFITKGLDQCLAVYSRENWRVIEERLSNLPTSKARNLQRMLSAKASECRLDAQGRILIPQNLRDYAGLTRDATVIGVGNRAEIWDTARWKAIEDAEMSAEALAETMESLGF